MKITCQSCQSKYNVADEKVQGKIVKIRCRKCGATIVVNGTTDGATNGAGADATAQQGAADTTQWHVNIGDNDQRTLSLSELVDAYNAGVVTQDTFIWCDGMDDWRPLAEVESVVAALHASANQIALGTPGAFEPQGAGAYEPQAPAQAAYEPPAPAYEPPPAYEAPAAAYAAAPSPEPKRAAVAKREARARDLFATNAGEELHTSAPAAPQGMAASGGSDGLTGQRNENSVLFSLAVLTKNAEERAPNDTGAANKEDSGLIDLKALAAKAESMRPAAMADDHVFNAPLGFAPPLGAPMGALAGPGGVETQPKSKLPLLIGGGAGVLVLLVLGIVIGVKIAGSGPAPVPVASAIPLPTMTTPAPSATQASAPEPSASAAPSASVAAATPKRFGGGGGGTWHPPGPGAKPPGGSGGTAGGSGGAPTPTPTPTPKKSGGDCGCNGDLMCLMKCSTH
jgi:predicted Zn finger-like uncharacterized protein